MEKIYLNAFIIVNRLEVSKIYNDSLNDIQSEGSFVFIKNKEKSIQSFYDNECQFSNNKNIDLILIDITEISCQNEYILKRIKEVKSNSKILITTSFNCNYTIYNILQNINSDGLIINEVFNIQEMTIAIKAIIKGTPYYSKVVIKLLRKQIKIYYQIDNIDRKILYELSKRTKTKDLSELVHLSQEGVKKRKQRLKKIFGVTGNGFECVLQFARENLII